MALAYVPDVIKSLAFPKLICSLTDVEKDPPNKILSCHWDDPSTHNSNHLAFSGWYLLTLLLFCRSESQWKESFMFPDFPTLQEILDPEMDLPISPDKVKNMAEKLIHDVKQRANQYQTQNFLWSWVSWGPSQVIKCFDGFYLLTSYHHFLLSHQYSQPSSFLLTWYLNHSTRLYFAFFLGGGVSHLAVLRDYSRFCVLRLVLVGLDDPVQLHTYIHAF